MNCFCCGKPLRSDQDGNGWHPSCIRRFFKTTRLPELDMTELFMRLVFSFTVGNSDMHLKNFSLIETEENSGRYQLSPAYDLLSVQVIMPEDPDQFALSMNGKKTKPAPEGLSDICAEVRNSPGVRGEDAGKDIIHECRV